MASNQMVKCLPGSCAVFKLQLMTYPLPHKVLIHNKKSICLVIQSILVGLLSVARNRREQIALWFQGRSECILSFSCQLQWHWPMCLWAHVCRGVWKVLFCFSLNVLCYPWLCMSSGLKRCGCLASCASEDEHHSLCPSWLIAVIC